MILPDGIERGVWRGKVRLVEDDRILTTDEWAYGNLLHSLDDPDTVHIYDFATGSYLLVDKDTIGEYTTVRDDEGNPIFEGDIVEGITYNNYTVRGEVVLHDGAFGVRTKQGFIPFLDLKSLKVIGNIYTNREK